MDGGPGGWDIGYTFFIRSPEISPKQPKEAFNTKSSISSTTGGVGIFGLHRSAYV